MAWKDFSYRKKGLIIGLILGIIWAIAGFLGVLICKWNPVHSISSFDFCDNPILSPLLIFALPTILAQLITSPIFFFGNENDNGLLLKLWLPLSPFILIILYSIIGFFIGWLYGKINNYRKNQ